MRSLYVVAAAALLASCTPPEPGSYCASFLDCLPFGTCVDGICVPFSPDPDLGVPDLGVPDLGVPIADAGVSDSGLTPRPSCTTSPCVDGEVCGFEDHTQTRSICKHFILGSGETGVPCDLNGNCPSSSGGDPGSCVQNAIYGPSCKFEIPAGTICGDCPAYVNNEQWCYFEFRPGPVVACGPPCSATSDCPIDQECTAWTEGLVTDPYRAHRYCAPANCHCDRPNSFCHDSTCYLHAPGCTLYDVTGCPNPAEQFCIDTDVCECTGNCRLTCTTDADCPGEAGLCLSGGFCGHINCATSSCPTGYVCGIMRVLHEIEETANHCIPPGPGAVGAACTTPGDCADGYCHLGQCVLPCSTNADCGGGECGVSPRYAYDRPFCWSTPRCSNCTQPNQYCDEYRRCI